MPGTPAKEVSVRFKVEASFGAGASGAGGEEFKIHPGTGGLALARGLVEDPEVRTDGQRAMARLGSKSVTGSYPGTLKVGMFNTLLAALFRSTWVADAVVTYNNAAPLTSLQVTANNTIVSIGTTTLLASGLRVGKVFRLTNMSDAANNDINLVCASISADGLTATVLGTPLTVQAADTACTLTIKKHLTNVTPKVRSSYFFEEYTEGFDESETFVGCRVVSLRLTFQPNAVVRVEVGIMGQDSAISPAGGTSPVLTAPTEYTAIGMVATDSRIFLAGVSQAVVTGGELVFDLGAQGDDVVGSTVTPDIYEGPMTLTGNLTAVRTGLTGSNLAKFIAETDNIELSLMFVEPDAVAPIDFFHVFVPRLKYVQGVSKTLGNEGSLKESVPIYGAAKATTTGYDATTATISTSV